MRVTIAAVGRIKAGPARALCADYIARIAAQGPAVGLRAVSVKEIAESGAPAAERRRDEEAERLLAALPAEALVIVMDERGTTLSSAAFARKLSDWRAEGLSDLAFLLGGPDGHGDAARDAARLIMSFGPMTWPHMFARAMLAEQLYRAVTILANHPYHRE